MLDRKSRQEITLWLFLASFITVAVTRNYQDPHLIKSGETKCSKTCQAEAFFQASMNLSADPCINFYEYACGNYIGEGTGGEVETRNLKIMVKMMDDMLKGNYDGDMLESAAINKTLKFYSKCKSSNPDESAKDENQVEKSLKEFEKLFGYKFNFCGLKAKNTNNDPTNLAKALAFLSVKYQVDTLVNPRVDYNLRRDSKFSSNYSLFLDQNIVTEKKPFYEPNPWKASTYESLKQSMLNLLKDYTKSINKECKSEILEYHVENLVEFERVLANNFTVNQIERRNFSRMVNSMKVGEISFEFLDWATFVLQISNLTDTNFVDISEIDGFYIIMAEPAAMKGINDYLQQVGMDTVVKYLYYRLLLSQRQFIKTNNYKNHRFSKTGKKKRSPNLTNFNDSDENMKSLHCGLDTMNLFPFPNARIFVEALYPTTAARNKLKEKVMTITKLIKSSMQSMIEDMPWISGDDETLRNARDKIQNMQINVAFPDFIFDNDKLDQFYDGINFDEEDDYQTMRTKIKAIKIRDSFIRLRPGTDVDRSEFAEPPADVQAFYGQPLNSIVINVGMLQQPYFDPEWPASINFGGIGSVIGHEINHGFDDKGIQWDKDGILNNWMTDKAKKSFGAMAKCVIEEYSNFTVIQNSSYIPNKINGEQTQGENLSDNGGIHAAYNSYRRWASINGPDPQMSGRIVGQLTHDQIFFLSFAQNWCAPAFIDDTLYQTILTDSHSPEKYRVFGTLQNFPAFKEVFNCEINSDYAPKRHCSVWVPGPEEN